MNRISVLFFLVDLYFSYLFVHEIGKLRVMCGIPIMLNMNKTHLLNISRTSSVFPSIIIDSITIVPCNNVKNLGFIFDDNINFSNQIANVCKSTNYQLFKI